VVELVGKAMGLTVGVTTAVVTGGYWSIAAGAVAYPLTVVVCSYCFAPYRPRLSLADMPLFSGFVGWMSAAQVISALNWQSERLLLGKLQTTARLGLFTTASDMAQIPFLALFGPITRPLLAAFSLLEGDKVRLRRSYRTVSRAIMAVGLPLVIGESLLAEPAVRLVLGEKWLAAAPLLRWLCLSVVPGLFALPAVPLVMSFGQTRMFLKRNLLEFSVKIPLVLIGGTWFGIVGIVIARVLSEAVAALYCTMVVRGMIGLSIREQLLGSWRYFVGTLVMAPPVIMCARHLGQIEGVVPSAAGLLMTVVLGASVYSAALWALWLFSGRPEGIEAMAIRTLSNMINKTRKHA
jgi:PST family polysaccharide transporter